MKGFGWFVYDNKDTPEIHVAGKIGKQAMIYVIGHEFAHYIQYTYGRNMDVDEVEEEAHQQGMIFRWLWLLRGKGELHGELARRWIE